MKKLFFIILLVTMTGVFNAGVMSESAAAQKEKAGKAQTTCPVLIGEIDKQIYTDYKGERIYFCCSQCIDDFNKNPDKYLKILKDSGIVLEKTPKAK
jgi:YHS domain-containing protein